MSHENANRLKALRLQRNWSQTELGRLLGVSSRTIQAMESGRYAPSITLAVRVARLLDQPVEAVFQI